MAVESLQRHGVIGIAFALLSRLVLVGFALGSACRARDDQRRPSREPAQRRSARAIGRQDLARPHA